jgi:hypothetical protein
VLTGVLGRFAWARALVGRVIHRARRSPRAMAGMVALGLVLVGVALGRLVFPIHTVGDVGAVVIPTSTSLATSTLVMPDITGLTVDQANRVLTDAGLVLPKVATEPTPQAGSPGLVVSQSPGAGSSLPAPQGVAVALKVSGPGQLPDVSGKSLQAARDELAELGVAVTIEEAIAADKPAGQVLSTSPAAGAALSPQVLLRVASAGDAVYLTDLKEVARTACGGTASAVVNGQDLRSALVCQPSARQAASIEYSLGRHGTSFDASIGIPDRSPPGTATLTLSGDGKDLGTFTAKSGEVTAIHTPVAGVLRLTIVVTTTAPGSTQVAIGEARIVGSTAEISVLAAQNG